MTADPARDTAERALRDYFGAGPFYAEHLFALIDTDPAARRALHQATADRDANGDTRDWHIGYEQGRSDERLKWAVSTPSPDDHRSDAKCSICGRAIFRAWIRGIEQPWSHWVEPVSDGHAATPSPDAATGLREALDNVRLYAQQRVDANDPDPGWRSILALAASENTGLREERDALAEDEQAVVEEADRLRGAMHAALRILDHTSDHHATDAKLTLLAALVASENPSER